jgi:hypothetical protein
MHHHRFRFHFYDPDRSPQLAKQWNVKKLYTVILLYDKRKEQVFRPNEETFANALLRLMNPRVIPLCFVTGHGEAGLWSEEQNGIKHFREALEANNYGVHEILLARDKIPPFCQLMIVPGPQRDWDPSELDLLKNFFQEGKSILFLMDPVDPGTGKAIDDFMKDLGIRLGSDVIVDKMSRMVGGDFLVPFVNQYVSDHPITSEFEMATFFPVARSVQPAAKIKEGIRIVPLALSGSGSWAETNLVALEKGEAAFESETDFPGPISLAVALEKKIDQPREVKPEAPGEGNEGRMVVVGDSDFITNNYIDLSGNKDLALKMIQWLAKDDRAVILHKGIAEFQPLFLNTRQRFVLLTTTLLGYPVFFLTVGALWIFWRRRTA